MKISKKFGIYFEALGRMIPKLGPAPNFALTMVFFAVVGLLWIPAIFGELGRARAKRADVVIPDYHWHVLYSDSRGICDYSASKLQECPANPDNPLLWESEYLRSDSKHYDRLVLRGYGEYWIGTTIEPELLEKAAALEANHLVLGLIRGPHRIWIDGEQIANRVSKGHESIVIPVPMSRLQGTNPIKIAIQIYNMHHVLTLTDYLAPEFGTGFVSVQKALAFKDNDILDWTILPITLFATYLLFALVHFVRWRKNPLDREFAYLAGFSLSMGLTAFKNVEVVFTQLRMHQNLLFGSLFAWMAAMFAFWAGMAFVRVGGKTLRWALPLCLTVPFVVFELANENRTITKFWLSTTFEGLGAVYCAGALFAVFRFAQLALEQRTNALSDVDLRGRLARLLVFAAAMVIMAYTRIFVPSGPNVLSTAAYGYQLAELLCFVLVSGVIHLEQLKARATETVPLSRYHLMAKPPAYVRGAVIAFTPRLASEMLRLTAARFSAETIWMDERKLLFFIEGDDEATALNQAHEFLAAARTALQTTANLTAQDEHLHAGISYGVLSPVWGNVGEAWCPRWQAVEGAPDPQQEAVHLAQFGPLFNRRGRPLVVITRGDAKSRLCALEDGHAHPVKEAA